MSGARRAGRRIGLLTVAALGVTMSCSDSATGPSKDRRVVGVLSLADSVLATGASTQVKVVAPAGYVAVPGTVRWSTNTPTIVRLVGTEARDSVATVVATGLGALDVRATFIAQAADEAPASTIGGPGTSRPSVVTVEAVIGDIQVRPPALAYVTPPTAVVTAGTSLGDVRLALQDPQGRVLTALTDSVIVALDPASGAPAAELFGTRRAKAVNGVVSLRDLSVQRAGVGYRLVATSPATATAASATFTVVPGAPDAGQSTVVISSNSTSVEGRLVVTVTVRDRYGNLIRNITPEQLGAVAGQGGVGPFRCSEGICTADYTAPKTSGADVVTVSLGGTPIGAAPLPVTITAGPAARFIIRGANEQEAGTTQTVTITAYDANGNVATGYTGPKSLTFSGASVSPAGFAPTMVSPVFGAATPVTFAAGVATAPMTLYTAETAVIAATDGSIQAAGFDRLTVLVRRAAPDARQSTLVVSRNTVQVNGTLVVTVTLRDAYGNLITDATPDLFVSTVGVGGLGAFTCAAGVCTATYTAPATAGSDSIRVRLGGTDITGSPAPITIAAGPAAKLVITGSATQTAGVAQTVTIRAFDAAGNVAPSYTGAKSLTISGAAVAPAGNAPTLASTAFGTATSVTFTNGSATASMVLYKAETAVVAATDGTLTTTGADRLTVTVSPNVPSAAQTTMTISTDTVTVGGTVTVTVTVRDAYGNVITNATGASFTPSASPGTLGAFTCVNGVCTATYTAPTTPGPVTIGVNVGGSPAGGSPTTVTVIPGAAAKLVITGDSVQTAGTSKTATITAVDANGNTATSYTGAKSLTFSGADSSAAGNRPTFAGTAFGSATNVTFTNGVATGALVLYKAQTAVIATTDGSISATGTDRLTVRVPAAAADAGQSTLAVSRDTVTVGGTVTVTVTLRDAFGNVLPTNDATLFASTASAGTLGGYTCVNGVCTATYTAPNTTGAPTIGATIGGTAIGGSPKTITVIPGEAAKLVITGDSVQTAGTKQLATITAVDANGNTATSYTGAKSLTFSGADSSAAGNRPTFAGTAFGSATSVTFTNGVATDTLVLYKAQTAVIATTDGTISAAGADRLTVRVPAAAADASTSTLAVSRDTVTVAGTVTVTVTLRDAFGNVLPTSDATLFASTASAGTLGGYTCVNGVCTATYTAPNTPGAPTIGATIGGTAISGSPKTITVIPGAAAYLAVTGDSVQVAGASQTATITAYDTLGNVATGYTGAKSLTISGASLAPNGTAPTLAATAFGTATSLTFTNGVATGTLVLYASEVALVNATDGTISATTRELRVRVTSSPFLNISLSGPASTPINETVNYTITARDVYGNVARPTADVQFTLGSTLAGSFAPNPVTLPQDSATVRFTFTPTVDGTHTVTATQVAGAATASAALIVTLNDAVGGYVVCTQSQSGGSSSAQTFTANLCATGDPATTRAQDDLELVIIALQPSNGTPITGVTMTAPAGWTQLGTAAQGPVQSWVFYRRFNDGDAATATFTSSSKNKWVVDMITYRGSNNSLPQLVTATSATTSITAPAITAPTANSIVYYNLASNNSTVAYTTSADVTSRTSNQVGGAANSMFGFDRLVNPDGTAPAATWTSATAVNSVLLALIFGF